MTLGQIAFEAYREYKQGITHDGREIPDWENLGNEIQEAWEAAAQAARAAGNTGRGLLDAFDDV